MVFGFVGESFLCSSDGNVIMSKGTYPLEELGGPMIRARKRKANETLQQVLSILFECKPKI